MFALNRRRMLLGLAAASSTAAGTSAKPAPVENPELIRLADDLPAIAAAYFAARGRQAEIRKAAAAVWPSAPEALEGHGGVYERDIAGAVIPSKRKTFIPGNARLVATVEQLCDDIRIGEAKRVRILKTKSKRGLAGCERILQKRKATLPIAERYWAEVEAAKARFPYEAASGAHTDALEALKGQVGAILSEDEWTMAGVVIKAQALAEWGKVEKLWRGFNAEGVDWPTQLADAIVRQAEG